MDYRISVGLRKALWQAAYLGAAAAIDAVLKSLTDSEAVQSWAVYPVVVVLLTMAGNWLKMKRTR